jgi:hypothetical protein
VVNGLEPYVLVLTIWILCVAVVATAMTTLPTICLLACLLANTSLEISCVDVDRSQLDDSISSALETC